MKHRHRTASREDADTRLAVVVARDLTKVYGSDQARVEIGRAHV